MSGQKTGNKQVISQETFNESVIETMELLGLNTQDALLETIQQFELMGVDLSYVEVSDKIVEGSDITAELVNLLKHMSSTAGDILTEMQTSVMVDTIDQLQNRALLDQAVSKRSSDLGVKETLLGFVQKATWPDVVKSNAMETMAVLTTGHQMTLTMDEVDVIFQLLKQRNPGGRLYSSALKWIFAACKKNEKNKQIVYDGGFTNVAVSFFEGHVTQDSPASIGDLETMTAILQSLSSDDDLNEDTPKFFERATELALKLSNNLLMHTVQLCEVFVENNEDVSNELSLAFNLLSNLALRDEYCKDMAETVTSTVLIEILRRSAGDDMTLATSVLAFIEKLVRNDDVRADFGKTGIFDLLEVLLTTLTTERMLWKTLLLISALTLRNPENSLKSQHLISPIISVMKKFEADNIQMAGTLGLYNIVSKKEQPPEIKEEIDGHVRGLTGKKPDLAFNARKVLNAIGLSVDVAPLWTGEHGDIVGRNKEN